MHKPEPACVDRFAWVLVGEEDPVFSGSEQEQVQFKKGLKFREHLQPQFGQSVNPVFVYKDKIGVYKYLGVKL